MQIRSIAAALAGVLIFGAGAVAEVRTDATPSKAVISPQAPASATPTPALAKPDIDAWLDGFMPYGLAAGDIPGAVVVIVKDGQVLTERGYGYADVKSRRKVDPKTTLFRPGSISKTFTWTAVMQQVEAGRIDLDADVNRYLDFKVPPFQGQPITVRNLMTHQPGYEEHLKRLFVSAPDQLQTLGDFLKTTPPERVYAPGKVPTYSNYGAAMAGYIVQRVSGENFDDYMDRHVFAPLDMRHATFRQPLPERFKADMATAYKTASGPAMPYELVNGEPAGSISVTGDDMSHFMIAHLQNGAYGSGRILQDATAKLMHAEQPEPFPPLRAMALGFVRADTNGHPIIGHDGGTGSFFSNMYMLPNDNVGVFVSMNGPGKDNAFAGLEEVLYRDFMDRYFPGPHTVLPTVATARAHGAAISGTYWPSRRGHSSFFIIAALAGQLKVTADPDGALHIAGSHGPARTWHEIGPWLWQDNKGIDLLKAVVEDGKVTGFTTESMRAVNVMQRVPGWALASWNMPLFLYFLATLLVMLALWPIQAIVRRAHGQSFPLSGRRAVLYRLSRVAAVVQLLVFAAYGYALGRITANVGNLDNHLDVPLRVGQGLALIGLIGLVVQLLSLVAAWTTRPSSWWAKLSTALVAVAGLGFAWFVVILHLLGPSTLF